MSLSKMKEAWGDYKKIVKSDYKNVNIRNFRYNIEQVLIPALKEINIEVDVSSANTMSDGEVSYEAIADGNLITISFMSNTAETDDNQVWAEIYTMTGKTSVGTISFNDTNQIQELFLDAMEELGLDVTDKPSEEELKQEKYLKAQQKKQQKPVTTQVKREPSQKEIPLPPEEPDDDDEDSEDEPELRQLTAVYEDAIKAYIGHGRINNEMKIQLQNAKKPGQFTFITCYYIDRTRCLAQCSVLDLDQVVNYTTLGKYLVDLSSMYQTTLITVYDGNGKEVFSEEVAEYKEGGDK